MREFGERKRMRHLILTSSSKNVIEYVSSCNFKVQLPPIFVGDDKNIDGIQMTSAIIPNIRNITGLSLKPYLMLKIKELKGFVYTNGATETVNSTIDYDLKNTEVGNFILVEPYHPQWNVPEGSKLIKELTLQILTPGGMQYDFLNSKYIILSMTNANPTVITIGPHGLIIGDLVFIRKITNASSTGMQATIESDEPYPITAIGANTITIGTLDLSSQAANQQDTGTLAAYPLGQGAQIANVSNGKFFAYVPGVSSFSTASPTVFNTGGVPHGFNTGDTIRITGFINGSTSFINGSMNQYSVITVTGANTFTIPVDLSGEAANQVTTGIRPAYPLGQAGLILDDKKQTTFAFQYDMNFDDFTMNKYN